jgi:hypothetical protein
VDVIQILRNAVNKTCNRLADLRKEIPTLEKAVHAAEELSFKAVKDYEETKLICEATDGKEPGQSPARVKRLEAYAERARKDEVTAHESLEAKMVALSRAMDESKVLIASILPAVQFWNAGKWTSCTNKPYCLGHGEVLHNQTYNRYWFDQNMKIFHVYSERKILDVNKISFYFFSLVLA